MSKCAAGIIVFNPNLERLKENIDAIQNQVDILYLYNNGTNDYDGLSKLLSNYSKVRLIGCGKNDGIPFAINKMAYDAIKHKVKWLLTLDQDSICPNDIIQRFFIYENEKNIGAICPLIVDKRRPEVNIPKEKTSEVKFCITSGCFMNLDVFKKIGGMDEYLFIGLVDNEYSYRLVSNGYKIIRVNSVILDHELGDITPSRFSSFILKVGRLLDCEKLKALSYRRKVSPFRLYYATRNSIYLSKKYPNSGIVEFTKKFAIKNGLISILRSHFRADVIKAFNKGIKEQHRLNSMGK